MPHMALRSMGEVPYYFSMSYVKFQGHVGWKINLDLIWDHKAGWSYQIPQICLFNDT